MRAASIQLMTFRRVDKLKKKVRTIEIWTDFTARLLYYQLVAIATIPCGLANQLESRIVSGSTAQPNEFPWAAHLTIYFWSGDAATCGGTVIGDRWILTAAHCTYGAINITVTLGAHDVSASSPDAYQQSFTTRTWITHPSWRYGDVENDIAIIQLPRAALLSSKPIIRI